MLAIIIVGLSKIEGLELIYITKYIHCYNLTLFSMPWKKYPLKPRRTQLKWTHTKVLKILIIKIVYLEILKIKATKSPQYGIEKKLR